MEQMHRTNFSLLCCAFVRGKYHHSHHFSNDLFICWVHHKGPSPANWKGMEMGRRVIPGQPISFVEQCSLVLDKVTIAIHMAVYLCWLSKNKD